MPDHSQRATPAADSPPQSDTVTPYDIAHAVIYLRLLDAFAEDADRAEIARMVLQLDPGVVGDRAYRVLDAHHARAVWMTKVGCRELLQKGFPERGWRNLN